MVIASCILLKPVQSNQKFPCRQKGSEGRSGNRSSEYVMQTVRHHHHAASGGPSRRLSCWRTGESIEKTRHSYITAPRHEAPPEKWRQWLEARPLPLHLLSLSHPPRTHFSGDLSGFQSIQEAMVWYIFQSFSQSSKEERWNGNKC